MKRHEASYNGRMSDQHPSFRLMGTRQLASALRDARARSLACFDALASAGYGRAASVPRLGTLNPPLWELGHIAWFAEWFVLRQAASSQPGSAAGQSLLARGDELFDSNTLAHAMRWEIDLPAPDALKAYCAQVLDQVCERLEHEDGGDAALYPYRLALAHEDMHGEALLYTMQTLGVAAQATGARMPEPRTQGQISHAGGAFLLGGEQSRGFVFDNERQAVSCRAW